MSNIPESDVRIEVNGQHLYKWVRYDIESDILQPADAFSFSVKNPGGIVADAARVGDEVMVLVDGTLQMTGIIDDVEGRIDPDAGPVLEIVGRDKFGQLIDESASLSEINGNDLQRVAELLGDPWVTIWRYENERNRLKLETMKQKVARIKNSSTGPLGSEDEDAAANNADALKKATANLAKLKAVLFPRVKVEPGESKLEVIQRLVELAGLHAWAAADGTGVIARPNYGQRQSFAIQLRVDEDSRNNNALSGTVSRSVRERYRTYRGVAHSANTRSTRGTGSRHDIELTDADCPLNRTLITSIKGQNRSQAREALDRMIAKRKFDALTATYRVRGHRQNGKIWQIDTIVSVDDQIHDLKDALYCTRRRFSGSASGQHTEVTLKPKDVWLA